MRQFVTLRFWMALLALVGITAGVWLLVRDSSSALISVAEPAPEVHRIDLISTVFLVNASPDFAMVDGVVQGEIRFIIDGTRTMVVKAGTPGEMNCARLAELAQCVVAADLLGDAVLWFSLVEAEPRATVTLPAIREVRDQGWVLLANGWEVQRASLVERDCADDTASLGEFIRQFGDNATSTFDFASQQVVKVTCTPPSP